jgi:hypothetical protein
MRDKVVAQRAYYGVRSRPIAAVHVYLRMLRCCPPNRTFVATVKSARGELTDCGLSELSLRLLQ